MRFERHRLSLWAFLAWVIGTAACTTLRPVEPDELRGPNPPRQIRVTETNDSTIVLHAPKVVDDTLVGFVDSTRRALALSGTTEIDTWEVDPGHTGAAIIFGGGLGALTYFVIEGYQTPPQPPKSVCIETLGGMVMC